MHSWQSFRLVFLSLTLPNLVDLLHYRRSTSLHVARNVHNGVFSARSHLARLMLALFTTYLALCCYISFVRYGTIVAYRHRPLAVLQNDPSSAGIPILQAAHLIQRWSGSPMELDRPYVGYSTLFRIVSFGPKLFKNICAPRCSPNNPEHPKIAKNNGLTGN